MTVRILAARKGSGSEPGETGPSLPRLTWHFPAWTHRETGLGGAWDVLMTTVHHPPLLKCTVAVPCFEFDALPSGYLSPCLRPFVRRTRISSRL